MKKLYTGLSLLVLVLLASCSNGVQQKDTQTSLVNAASTDTNVVAKAIEKSANTLPHKPINTSSTTKEIIKKAEKINKQNNTMLPTTPQFSDADVNKGVHEFAQSMQEKVIALQHHDTAKLNELEDKLSGMPSKMTMWIFKMSSDERQSFKTYLEAVTKIAKQADKN